MKFTHIKERISIYHCACFFENLMSGNFFIADEIYKYCELYNFVICQLYFLKLTHIIACIPDYMCTKFYKNLMTKS